MSSQSTLDAFLKTKPIGASSYHLTLPHGDSWLEVHPRLPPELLMDPATFERIWALHPKDLATGTVGPEQKAVTFQRWTEMYGHEHYDFSGQRHEGQPLDDPFLQTILAWIQKHSGQPYQGLLINWYKDGSHYIGKHRDKETQLVKGSAIYSLSYGQDRDFVIEADEQPCTYRKVIHMNDGSGIIMGGQTQTFYKHSVPPRAKSKCMGRRINITARLFKGA